jgi:hypothetical protein
MAKVTDKRLTRLDSGLLVPCWASPRWPRERYAYPWAGNIIVEGGKIQLDANNHIAVGCLPTYTGCSWCTDPIPQTLYATLSGVVAAASCCGTVDYTKWNNTEFAIPANQTSPGYNCYYGFNSPNPFYTGSHCIFGGEDQGPISFTIGLGFIGKSGGAVLFSLRFQVINTSFGINTAVFQKQLSATSPTSCSASQLSGNLPFLSQTGGPGICCDFSGATCKVSV